jgi:hypothetical protein
MIVKMPHRWYDHCRYIHLMISQFAQLFRKFRVRISLLSVEQFQSVYSMWFMFVRTQELENLHYFSFISLSFEYHILSQVPQMIRESVCCT